jgi:hypothetical protein
LIDAGLQTVAGAGLLPRSASATGVHDWSGLPQADSIKTVESKTAEAKLRVSILILLVEVRVIDRLSEFRYRIPLYRFSEGYVY